MADLVESRYLHAFQTCLFSSCRTWGAAPEGLSALLPLRRLLRISLAGIADAIAFDGGLSGELGRRWRHELRALCTAVPALQRVDMRFASQPLRESGAFIQWPTWSLSDAAVVQLVVVHRITGKGAEEATDLASAGVLG